MQFLTLTTSLQEIQGQRNMLVTPWLDKLPDPDCGIFSTTQFQPQINSKKKN